MKEAKYGITCDVFNHVMKEAKYGITCDVFNNEESIHPGEGYLVLQLYRKITLIPNNIFKSRFNINSYKITT